ncbi:hypothetical protein N5079_27180 [Planotetraspora sp. A-T 1434]|uniref:hypothetical protein n=1 Tax=Planotetraspora sp. A-T 1434 TaxID=2979219 RepID=UPI0021BE68AB|nr:hypothetical protein [Planotetraspora sp. A-T 1434]MCT9933901.1 hypothetical protein [Planotetraspora sp. A-T 1434]
MLLGELGAQRFGPGPFGLQFGAGVGELPLELLGFFGEPFAGLVGGCLGGCGPRPEGSGLGQRPPFVIGGRGRDALGAPAGLGGLALVAQGSAAGGLGRLLAGEGGVAFGQRLVPGAVGVLDPPQRAGVQGVDAMMDYTYERVLVLTDLAL